MADYYGVTPPQVVCVSATLYLGIRTFANAHESVRRLRHRLRDVEWNPQRHLPRSPDYEPLIRQRAEVVRRAITLREHEPGDRDARRLAFAEIRGINAAMLEARRAHPLHLLVPVRRPGRTRAGEEGASAGSDRPGQGLLLWALRSQTIGAINRGPSRGGCVSCIVRVGKPGG